MKKQETTIRTIVHIEKRKDGSTRTPLKADGEHGCSGRVSSSCSTNATLGVPCVKSMVIHVRHERGKNDVVVTVSTVN